MAQVRDGRSMSDVDEDADREEPSERIESEQQEGPEEPVVEEVEEQIRNPQQALRNLGLKSDLVSRAGEGFRALREGVSEFFVASDRSAGRTKDTADKVIDLIQGELDREGLSPEERLEFIQAGERMANQVGDSEKEVQESNERTFTKIATIAAGAAVGVVLLGYLAKEGKLPLDPPTT